MIEPDFRPSGTAETPLLCSATDLLAERSFTRRRPSEIHIVEEAREPPPAGPRNPGEPRARNASAGEGRIGCAMTRAARRAAVPTDLLLGTQNLHRCGSVRRSRAPPF